MKSIRVQLASVVLSLLLVLIAVYTILNIRAIRVTVRDHQLEDAQLVSDAILSGIRAAMNSERKMLIHNTVQEMGRQPSVARIRVLRPDGRVISSSQPAETLLTMPRPPLELFAEKIGAVAGPDEMLDGKRTASTYTPVMLTTECRRCHQDRAPVRAVIQTSLHLESTEQIKSEFETVIILSGVLAFILAGVILWFATGALITRPTQELQRSMQRVEAGDLTVRLRPGPDEIGRLAASFNTMVEELDGMHRQLEESHAREMERAGRLATVGELAAGVAHEIKNPLAGISGAIEVMVDDLPADDPNRDILEEVLVQVRRVDKTIRDLLNFARPTKPTRVTSSLNELVHANLTMATRTPEQQEVRCTTELQPDLPEAWLDEDQIEQVLLNLVLNALQAAAPEGRIIVRTHHDPGARVLLLEVEDSGSGVDPKSASEIFRPFYTTKAKGTGLGLAISRRIARDHGGNLYLAEPTELQGARFVLEIPLSGAQGDPDIR